VQTIDELLDTLPQPDAPRRRGMIDATQDYIGYLMQQHPEEEGEDNLTGGLDIIDEYLKKEHPRIKLSQEDEADGKETSETDETTESSGLVILPDT